FVAGYGLNGRNLAAALRSIRAPYLIVELNAQTVRQARARGEPAFYGDATREEILRGLGAERARMLVVAISDPAATRRMVRVARALNPRIHIIARTRYVVEMPELTRLAATGLRSQTGALVLSVVRGDEEVATPGPQFRLLAGDVLVVVGQPHQLQAAARLTAGNTAAITQQC